MHNLSAVAGGVMIIFTSAVAAGACCATIAEH